LLRLRLSEANGRAVAPEGAVVAFVAAIRRLGDLLDLVVRIDAVGRLEPRVRKGARF
jgi:hypothetical protein